MHTTDIIRLLRDLVSLPSVNPMGRALAGPEVYEHRVTAYLEDFFRDLRVPFERQPVAPLRDNILARHEAGSGRPTILWEVHQDTVPTDHMVIDPFAAAVRDGRLYGRGACDVKGGMAAMLAAFARLARERPPQACNITLACSVDEEHTFTGVTEMVRRGLRADMAVVAEPTRLQIVQAHKGVMGWHVATPGRACHGSSPELGVNAIYRMGRVLIAIERYAEQLRASRRDPLLGPPTLSVGRIEGGTSVNTVPDWCRVEVDRRVIPGEDPRAAPADLAAYLKDVGGFDFPVEVSEPWKTSPALAAKESAEIITRLGRAIEAVKGSHQVTAVPYGTDASTVAAGGIPAVVFGPGDIAQAHTNDEWIVLDEVAEAAEILYRLACAA